jgi:hypothetical protein
VAGNNQNVPEADMAIWDPNAQKLYPLVPGQFRAKWTNESGTVVQVLVDALPPEQPHYPHIASTPPVQLTPDPTGTFFFKALKYSENDAAISEGSLFSADAPGRSVLLFGEIKIIGRGDPKEYLRVRMVQTRAWDDALPAAATCGHRAAPSAIPRSTWPTWAPASSASSRRATTPTSTIRPSWTASRGQMSMTWPPALHRGRESGGPPPTRCPARSSRSTSIPAPRPTSAMVWSGTTTRP